MPEAMSSMARRSIMLWMQKEEKPHEAAFLCDSASLLGEVMNGRLRWAHSYRALRLYTKTYGTPSPEPTQQEPFPCGELV